VGVVYYPAEAAMVHPHMERGAGGRDWQKEGGLVSCKPSCNFFWQGGPGPFPPRARFFSLGFTFCETEQDTRYP